MTTKFIRRRAVDATIPVSVRVGRDLADKINELREEAKRYGLMLDLPAFMADALKKFAKQAEKDLADIKKANGG